MGNIIVIFLIIAVVKFVLFGLLLYVAFRPDLRSLRRSKVPAGIPTCVYCKSRFTRAVDEGQTRWEDDDLVLVTTYECEHCRLPFWHVERVPVGSLKR